MTIQEKVKIIKDKLDESYNLLKTLKYEEGIELATRGSLGDTLNLSLQLIEFLNYQKTRQERDKQGRGQ